jgi:hypothetical protein
MPPPPPRELFSAPPPPKATFTLYPIVIDPPRVPTPPNDDEYEYVYEYEEDEFFQLKSESEISGRPSKIRSRKRVERKSCP